MKYILPSRRCYGISLTNAVTFFSHENCTLETLTLCKEQQTLLPQTLHQISCKVTGQQLISSRPTYYKTLSQKENFNTALSNCIRIIAQYFEFVKYFLPTLSS